MSLNIGNCDCNDYSLQTANTGIATVSIANSNLNGTGSLATVLTAGQNGTVIKSIIIKCIAATDTGMVRLFVGRDNPVSDISLIREVPIPVYPNTPSTPTPSPLWPMLEIDLVEPITLQPNYILYASTQTTATFNVIAEGLDWEYPNPLPTTCCNFVQESANTGIETISTANANLNGSGTIVSVFTAANNGSIINSITISALQSTHKGMVRFFIGPDGVAWTLMMEVVIPETNQSAFQPSFKQVLAENFHLESGFHIGAATQNAESFAITIDGTNWSYPI